MVRVKLREAMEAYRFRTGKRLTYATLAKMAGVGQGTLSSIGSRAGYNVTLATVEKISIALETPFFDLIELTPDPPELESESEPELEAGSKAEASPKKAKKKKKTKKKKKKTTRKKKRTKNKKKKKK